MPNHDDAPASSISRHSGSQGRVISLDEIHDPAPIPPNPFIAATQLLSPYARGHCGRPKATDQGHALNIPYSTVWLKARSPSSPSARSQQFPETPNLDDEPDHEAEHEDENDDPDLPLPNISNGNEDHGNQSAPNPSTADAVNFANIFTKAFAEQMVGAIETVATKFGKQDSGSSKARVHDPNVFDSSDPKKLQSFLVSLSLVFADGPSHFTDKKKISYMLSYLGGFAKEWFEPDLLNPDPNDPPAWMFSFESLVQELTDNFGVYDAEGEAEDKLRNLSMHETNHIHKYMIKFASLAASSNWDQSALQWAFRSGLATRLKDELARLTNPPRTLIGLCQEAQRLDNRYWKRESERKRETARQPNSSKPNNSSPPDQKPWKGSSSSSKNPPQSWL